jgi:uncharacterized protein (DUF983 family)
MPANHITRVGTCPHCGGNTTLDTSMRVDRCDQCKERFDPEEVAEEGVQ